VQVITKGTHLFSRAETEPIKRCIAFLSLASRKNARARGALRLGAQSRLEPVHDRRGIAGWPGLFLDFSREEKGERKEKEKKTEKEKRKGRKVKRARLDFA
jgi:hypothetical protein